MWRQYDTSRRHRSFIFKVNFNRIYISAPGVSPPGAFSVRPARTYSKGCKSLNCPDSGKVTAKGKGVRRETESEGNRRQTSGLTDRNPI